MLFHYNELASKQAAGSGEKERERGGKGWTVSGGWDQGRKGERERGGKEGGREGERGGKEGGRERERGKEGGREGKRREGGRERGREGREGGRETYGGFGKIDKSNGERVRLHSLELGLRVPDEGKKKRVMIME